MLPLERAVARVEAAVLTNAGEVGRAVAALTDPLEQRTSRLETRTRRTIRSGRPDDEEAAAAAVHPAPGPGAPVGARADVDGAVLPDTVVDGATHGPLTVRAASVRGDSHRYHAEPRQDAVVVARLGAPGEDTGVLLLGVADGVGSVPRSHLGSHLVCREIVGDGGQGEVRTLAGRPGLLYKSYREPHRVARDSLAGLVSVRLGLRAEERDRLDASTAWPPCRGVDAGRVTGFLMNEAPASMRWATADGSTKLTELAFLLRPGKAAWQGVVQPSPAERLALVVALVELVDRLHATGLGFGDLSEANVLWTVRPEPAVHLIDCDGARLVGADPVLAQAETPDWRDPLAPAGAATGRGRTWASGASRWPDGGRSLWRRLVPASGRSSTPASSTGRGDGGASGFATEAPRDPSNGLLHPAETLRKAASGAESPFLPTRFVKFFTRKKGLRGQRGGRSAPSGGPQARFGRAFVRIADSGEGRR
ncbi:protein phosphatase 2C domain-containing protein [Streptomyces sp. H27-H5]|uniref:protein phosphatase 2C domain-containing protein n=1 Tax=Streptomyces sp. H27-H5 TaxID=2996460 RepID=UPI00227016A2|nr:protein phosphatase 2C domain-containing protein [Streptomyces sp. H27-H5]MCY0955756.1 protein phosphatase 2C domain-containing protein [Streptomyces sp. H27-H5]